MPESSVQEAVLRLARQLKLIPTAPPGNPGPAYHPGPEWPVQSLSDAASVPAQFFGELLRGLMDPLGANNQAPVENIGALLGAAMPLAGGLRGLRAGQFAEEAATAGRAAKGAQGIKAYHGSPHDFDKFSLSKIGTGEGAQAYGHGLYFAEKPGVAAYYKQAGVVDPRDAMTQIIDSARTYNGDDMQLRGVIKSGLYRNPALSRFGDSDAIVNDLVQVVRGHETGGTISPAAMSALQRVDRAMGELPKGRMYEVSINADPEHLLDWDKPLSQQPETVRSAVMSQPSVRDKIAARAKILGAKANDPTGQQVYADMTGWKRGVDLSPPANASSDASATLRRAGIPGIKYLDGGSRASGEGSRNFVIFDDSLVSILKKYGVALPMIEALRRKATTNNGTVPANDVHGLIGS